MSKNTQDSVALLNWDGTPAKTIQDVDWVFEQRDDSTNRLRVTTTLAEVDGVESEQELVFKNRRFIVSEIDRDRDAGEAVLVADEAQVELGGIILTDFAFNSWTAFQALEFALEGTRWTPGEVQNVRFGRANFDDLTVLEACHFLANHQDAVLSFDSLRRRVNLTATRGTVREEVFTYGRQLTNIEKSERQPTLTTLHPMGADDMTVARVNDGSAVVEDYGYYTSRGISLSNARRWYKKEEYWEDSRYEVAENMLRDAQKRLADEAYPQITYTLTAQATTSVDGTDDFDLTDIGLGDRVYVWDQEIDTKLVAEVTAVTTSSDASANELVLSTLPESFGGSGSRGGGYYFGDSGSTAGNPLFPRSGFQPRPSMPILEELSQLGVAEVRWNGQDHNGDYDTIPVRFGSVIPRVARLGVDGSIPSPDSDDAFEGTVIHERGGGTATVAFGASGSYAVWFYMLGQDQRTTSQYSEPLTVEVKPFVDVEQMERDLAAARDELEQATIAYEAGQEDLGDRLDYLNQTRIPELQQAIQNARDAADQSFAALDDRVVSAETDLATAKTDIANAQTILNPLPGEIQEAKQDVQAAQAAAEAAQAGVQEALQNVSNYLPNGGFELGLDHWSTTGTVALNANSNTGDNAAFLWASSSLTSTTVIPVDVDQVWEVGFYSRATSGTMQASAMLAGTEGDPVSVIDQLSVPAYGSYRFYSFRVEIPSGVPFMVLQFSTTSASANRLVDDVSLKNVTDVVRLERAAAEATAKAQEALDKYEDMQFFVNGVADDLSDAKDLLATKADTSRLNELDGKLAELGTHFTKVWRQATPPPAGTTYEWDDGAHMSESVKKIDGQEVARNLVPNPSFELGTDGWQITQQSAGSLAIQNWPQMQTGSRMLAATSSGTQQWLQFRDGAYGTTFIPAGAAWVGGRFFVATGLGGNAGARFLISFYDAENQNVEGGVYVDGTSFKRYNWYEGATLDWAVPVPAGAVRVRHLFQGMADAGTLISPTSRMWTDAHMVTTGDSEAAVREALETYFDGDTPDDRQNDLWYDADGVPHFWRKGWGWAVLEDQRLDNLGQLLDDAQDDLQEALEGPIDHERLRVGTGAFDEAFASKLIADHATIINAAMRNLSVSEKLLFAEAIGEELWAELGVFDRLQAREGWIGNVHLGQGVVTAEKMTITGDMAAAIVNADKGRFINLLAEDLIANNATLITAAIENLDVTEQSNFNDAFADKLHAEEFTARSAALARAVVAAPNFAPPPGESPDEWRVDSPWTLTTSSHSADGMAFSGTHDSNQGRVTGPRFPVTPGETLKFDFDYGRNGSNRSEGGRFLVGMMGYATETGSAVSFGPYIEGDVGDGSSGWEGSAGWGTAGEGTVEVPEGVYWAAPTLYIYPATGTPKPNAHSTIYNLRVTKLLDGTLIATNSIKTPQLDVDQIFGNTAVLNKLFADLITARLLNAQEAMIGGVLIKNQAITVNHLTGLDSILTELLRAKKIEAGDIDANAINGMTITGGVVSGGRVEGAIVEGGTVRVGPRFTGGSGNAGIELASNGVIRRWDTAGNLDMVLDGNNNRITGRVSTARPGSPGVIIEPSTTAGNPGIFFASGGSASGNNSGVVHDNDWNMVIRGRRTSSGAARQRTKVEGGFHITSGRLTSDVEATFTDGVQVSGSDSHIYPRLIVHDWLHNPGAPSNSTSPANVRLGGTGNYGRYFSATSSRRRAKINIETVQDDVAERILDLDPRDWLDRHELEVGLGDEYADIVHHHDEPGVGPTADENTLANKLGYSPRRVPGVVAEELIEVGLGGYATYGINQETGEEELESVAYDRLWILFIPIVRKLRDRVNALEETVESQAARIDDLESRLAALEARL